MIGKHIISIDYSDFIQGMSISEHLPDGGFSPTSINVNPAIVPGTLYGSPNPVTITTAPTKDIICGVPDPVYLGSPSGSRYKFLDEDGAFYSFNSASNGLTKPATASSDKVSQGTTDFIVWRNDAGTFWYATTMAGANGNIIRWNGDTTLVEDWWTNATYLNQAALSSTTPWRPMLVYERNLYVGDGNKLHRIAPDGTVSNGILVFEANENISALGIDKSTGYMMIAVNPGANASAGRNTGTAIRLYDGYSNKVARDTPMRGLVTCFKNLDDATYVFYDNNLGIFTGSGVRFLRKLEFAIGSGSDYLIYPHRATVMGNTLYFLENKDIIAYGEVRGNSQKVFYPIWRNDSTTLAYGNRCLLGVDDYKLAIAYNSGSSTYPLKTLDTASTTSTSMNFIANRTYFPRPIKIREVYFEFDTSIANGVDAGQFYIYSNVDPNEGGNAYYSVDVNNDTGVDTYSLNKTFPANGKALRFIQPRIDITSAIGLRRIVISYDVAE